MLAYKNWAGVGTVWLEKDKEKNNYKQKRQSGNQRNTAENIRSNQSEENILSAESETLEENKKLVAADQDLIREENVHADCVHVKSTTEILSSATKKKSASETPEILPNQNSADYPKAASSAVQPQSAALPLLNNPPGTQGKKQSFQVNTDDFKKLDLSSRGPCDRCGSRYVDYTEKVTKDRIARKNEPSRKICKKCYATAKKREAETFRTLPGALNIAGMVRTDTDFGRCVICNKQKAVWRDPVNHIHICDSCFANAGGVVTQGGEPCHI